MQGSRFKSRKKKVSICKKNKMKVSEHNKIKEKAKKNYFQIIINSKDKINFNWKSLNISKSILSI